MKLLIPLSYNSSTEHLDNVRILCENLGIWLMNKNIHINRLDITESNGYFVFQIPDISPEDRLEFALLFEEFKITT